MIIPFGIKVINENVVYSDTVLNLKELGEKLVVTCVDDVRNSKFEECIRLIFSENKDVVFNTVQYSRKNQKIYLYTDRAVSIKSWTDRNKKEFSYQSYDRNILEKIKSDLSMEDSLALSIISLYDVWSVYDKKEKDFDSNLDKIKSNINKSISENFENKLSSVWYRFWNDSIEISVRNYDYGFKGDSKFVFKREKNGDLYISGSDKKLFCFVDESKLLMYIGDDVSKIFTLYDDNRIWRDDLKRNVMSSSDIFTANIINNSISIKSTDGIINMELYGTGDKIKINCNSNDILSCIKGNEIELFKKIFVKIEDCPESIKNELYYYRYNYVKKMVKEKIMQAKKAKTLGYKIKTFIKKRSS